MLFSSNGLPRLFANMEQASPVFYLTGSRFFGNNRPDSDWDFFVDWSIPLADWLESNWFVRESGGNYLMDTTGISEIWKHVDEPVHIQVVDDVSEKAAVQDILASDPTLVGRVALMSKENRKVVWDAAFVGYHRGHRRPRW